MVEIRYWLSILAICAVFYVLEVEGGLRLEGDGTAARS
jgi:hypothetical protein